MSQGYADVADAMREVETPPDLQALEGQAAPQTFQQQDPDTKTQTVLHGAGVDERGRSTMSTHVQETPPIRSSESVVERNPQPNPELQSPPHNTNVEIQIQTMSPPETALQRNQNETETNIPASKTLNLGKSHLKIIIALGLAVATIGYGKSNLSSPEGVKILSAAVISNMVAFLGCLADILLHRHNKPNAARIVERVAFAGTTFAFTTIVAGCLGLKTSVVFGFATVVTLLMLIFMCVM